VTAAAAPRPVAVLTGMDDARQSQEALRLGAEDWLTKPWAIPRSWSGRFVTGSSENV
jgi:DNA-binding response OmpR family regulator